MPTVRFWRRWLLSVSSFIVLFGLALAFFNQSPLFDVIFNRQIDPGFWPGGVLPPEAAAFQQWIYGVLGATVAGWGLTLWFIAYYPFQRQERWAWRALIISLGLWYVVDTPLSIAGGAAFNALFNTALLSMLLPPLLATRRHFQA